MDFFNFFHSNFKKLKKQKSFKNSLMTKILTKKIQTQLSQYFLSDTQMTKPETRCLKEMVLGILKSKSVFVNQIAASLREPLNPDYAVEIF